jgi:hypothetical protein
MRRQIVGFAAVTAIMMAVLFVTRPYGKAPQGPWSYLEPTVIVALWPLAVVIAIAIAVLQYHLYDVRVVIRRVVVYGGLTVALTLSSSGSTSSYWLPYRVRSLQFATAGWLSRLRRRPFWRPSRCGGVSRSGWSAGSSANGATRWECLPDSMRPCLTGTKKRTRFTPQSPVQWLRPSAHPR